MNKINKETPLKEIINASQEDQLRWLISKLSESPNNFSNTLRNEISKLEKESSFKESKVNEKIDVEAVITNPVKVSGGYSSFLTED